MTDEPETKQRKTRTIAIDKAIASATRAMDTAYEQHNARVIKLKAKCYASIVNSDAVLDAKRADILAPFSAEVTQMICDALSE